MAMLNVCAVSLVAGFQWPGVTWFILGDINAWDQQRSIRVPMVCPPWRVPFNLSHVLPLGVPGGQR